MNFRRTRDLKTTSVATPRTFKRTLVALGLAIGLATIGSPAQAATAPNGATWYPTTTTCNVVSNYITREAYVKPQPGRTWQYVSTRTYVLDTRTNQGVYGPWTPATVVYANSGSVHTIGGGELLPDRSSLRFYTEIMWWDGSKWTSRVGAWDAHYTNAGYGAAASYACMT